MPILSHVKTAMAACACALLATPALAAAAAAKEPPNAARNGENLPLHLAAPTQHHAISGVSGGASIVRTLVGLAIVVALIYALYWVLRRVRRAREQRGTGQGLETIATVSLGANRALHLVRAGDDLVLVGVGEHAVTPIRTYTETEARAVGLLPEVAGDDVIDAAPARGARAPAGLPALVEELRRRTVRA